MANKIKLNEVQVEYLTSLPEQGIGYQIVDLTLSDGNVLKNRIVLNSSYLALNENEMIRPNEIITVKLHNPGQ